MGKIDTIVDGLDASRIDSVHLDAMSADLVGYGKDRIGSTSHEPISDIVLSGPKNSHVSAAPYQLCLGHRFCYKSSPKIGTLKKSMDDLDLLQFEKLSKLEGRAKRSKVVSALQG